MLYERWLAVVRERGHEPALRDFASDRQWSFRQLADEVESGAIPSDWIVHPQGQSADFVLTVLRGWRAGRVVCPLESGQPPPNVTPPPAGCGHLKTTSATTGAPRLIAFTPTQLAADAANIVATMGLRPEWPNLGVISMAHSYGFSNLVLPLLLHGIPLIVIPSPLPEMLRAAATAVPHLTLPAVPALWRVW
ncbi:MAG: class I adenylate-forming enzyme family protein, partial [Limisphaerales bacterium]